MDKVFSEELMKEATCSQDELDEARAYGEPFEYEEEGLVLRGYIYDGKLYVASIT